MNLETLIKHSERYARGASRIVGGLAILVVCACVKDRLWTATILGVLAACFAVPMAVDYWNMRRLKRRR